MIRRPPRSTLDRSSAASDVYKRQIPLQANGGYHTFGWANEILGLPNAYLLIPPRDAAGWKVNSAPTYGAVSYTHLRAHETVLDLVCRLLLEKKTRRRKE